MGFVAAILAGGESKRFGADKAFAQLAGRPMLAHVARALAGAESLAVVGNGRAAALLGVADLRDPSDAVPGPLAGVLAALDWAQSVGAAWLVTAPCDTPLLPNGLGETLITHAASADAAYACSADGVHALCAAWRPALAARLRGYFASGVHPPVRDLAPKAVRVAFADGAAFMNVNTPADMARAEALLGGG
ncbi:MAG: molybdenum cofactor guanylyltransferase [Terricaulis sp.]